MLFWVSLAFIFIAVFAGTLTLLSAAISAFEIRHRRLAELKAGRPVQPQMTPSAKQDKKPDIDPAPLVSGLLQNSAFGKRLQLEILKAGLMWRPSEFMMLCAGGAVGGYIIGMLSGRGSIPMGAMIGIVGLLAPYVYLKAKQSRRQVRLSAQIPDMLDILSSSLRSGHSFLSGVQIIVTQMQQPITDEFARVVQEVKFGASLNDALTDLVHRTENYDMELIISAVQTQLAVGGNLAEILDTISFTIRERVRIKGEISALTAQGRITAWVISLLPVALMGILWLVNRSYIMQFFNPGTRTCGIGMLVIAGLMVISGFFAVQKIVAIDI